MTISPSSLKALRLRNKLTQSEFGYRIGLDASTISYYESGKHPIPQSVALALVGVGLLVRKASK